jgi:hypothetical protein
MSNRRSVLTRAKLFPTGAASRKLCSWGMDSSKLIDTLRAHWAIGVGLLSTLFIALRIMSAAWFNPDTAYAILQAGGAGSVFVGAALSSIGSVAPIVATAPILVLQVIKNDDRHVIRDAAIAIGVIAGIVSIVAAPILVVLSTFIPWGAMLWMTRSTYKKITKARHLLAEGDAEAAEKIVKNLEGIMQRHKLIGKLAKWKYGSRIVLASYALPALLVVFNLTMWLPIENITIGHDKPRTAFVLSYDGNDAVLLISQTRAIEYVPSDEITMQQVCNSGNLLAEKSLLSLLASPHYPSCAQLSWPNVTSPR